MRVCSCSMFCCTLLYVHHLDGEERAGCFVWFVFLVSRDGCMALPRRAMGLSEVCNCGICLTILTYYFIRVTVGKCSCQEEAVSI